MNFSVEGKRRACVPCSPVYRDGNKLKQHFRLVLKPKDTLELTIFEVCCTWDVAENPDLQRLQSDTKDTYTMELIQKFVVFRKNAEDGDSKIWVVPAYDSQFNICGTNIRIDSDL